MDNRSLPVPQAKINLVPAAIAAEDTGPAGQYRAYLPASDAYNAFISHAGYDPDPWLQTIQADQTYELIFPPLDDLVQNGNFETNPAALVGWQTGGTIPPEVVTGTVHAGSLGAFLGQACPEPCLDAQEKLNQTVAYQIQPKLVVDPTGVVHTISADFNKLYYASRSPQGAWSGPVVIGNNGNYYNAWDFDVAMDDSGNIHAIWSGEKIYYAIKPASGSWSTPIELGTGDISQSRSGPPGECVRILWYE